MIATYWVAFWVGLVSLIGWIFLRGLAHGGVAKRWDPEARLAGGKIAVAAVLGFGMGGLSSSYGGWGSGSIWGAVLGAMGATAYTWWVAKDDEASLDGAPDAAISPGTTDRAPDGDSGSNVEPDGG